MEPFDVRVQQVTFRDGDLSQDDVDSFSTVVNYDSHFTQTDAEEITKPSIGITAALKYSHNNQDLHETLHSSISSLKTCVSEYNPSSKSTPENCREVELSCQSSEASQSGVSYEVFLKNLVKDIYSDKAVPFNTLTPSSVIPSWIFVASDERDKTTQQLRRPRGVAQPSRLKSTQSYSHALCSHIPPPAEHSLINPNHNFIDSGQGYITRKERISQSDIRTLFQVSSNTAASKSRLKKQFIMADGNSEHSDAAAQSDGQAFETVAEALRLQWSVIGDKKITPASPEVVAQIVAEAEKRLKAGTSPTPPMTPPMTLASQSPTHLKSHLSASPVAMSTGTSSMATPEQSSQNSAIASNANTNNIHVLQKSKNNAEKAPDSVHAEAVHQHAELVRMPAGSVTTIKEKSQSWFAGKTVAPMDNKPSKQKLVQTVQPSMEEQTTEKLSEREDVQSVSSAASELDQIGMSETDQFLKSLPPYKAINISDILPQTTAVRGHSPPVKETSFKPIQGQGRFHGDGVTSSAVERNPNVNSVAEIQHPATQMTDSGIGIDLSRNFSDFVKQPVVTSTPKKSVIDTGGHLPIHTISSEKPTVQNIARSFGDGDRVRPPEYGATQKLNEILREKAKLEGQLEMLTHEAQVSLQERSELQSQITTLKQKLKSQKDHVKDEEKQSLKGEVEKLRSSRSIMEQSLASAQKFLEEKVMEAKILTEDLQVTQEANDKLQMRIKELRDNIRSKDMTIQALKNKIAELYVEVQMVMQSKMESDNEARGARSDLTSLVNAKLWYQQQLQAANEAKSALQQELTTLQSQVTSQGSVIERLKTENTKIRHQLKETQQRAIKDKEILAKHLETIESDMMEREAAFQEIQRERTMLEGTFDSKLETVEQERIRFQSLYHVTNDLENQLDRAQGDTKKKQSQIFALENEQIELMKKLTLSQESVIEKERVIEELQQKLIGVEEELKAFQSKMSHLDSEIWKLKEEKASTEISLKAALEEKASVDMALDNLKSNMGKVEKSFRHMKQELSSKSTDFNKLVTEKMALQTELEKVKKDVEKVRREDEKADREMDEKEKILEELQLQKVKLETEVTDLKNRIDLLESTNEGYVKEKEELMSNVAALQERLSQATNELAQARVEVESNQKAVKVVRDTSADQELANENSDLKEKIQGLEKQHNKELRKHESKVEKLTSDLGSLQTELTDRQATYDTNVELLSCKLREITAEKEHLETEFDSLQRKFDVSMLEKQDAMKTELQSLVSEIEELKLQKQTLEMQLFDVQREKELEVQGLQQKLSALDNELHHLRASQSDAAEIEELNQRLSLELEKEKGKVEGLLQTNASLKHHVSQLEANAADLDTTLSDLQQQVTMTTKEKEEARGEYEKKIGDLEEGLKEEGKSQRELRKQIGTKITENKKLKRQLDAIKLERESLQQDLDQKVKETEAIQTDLESQRQISKGQTTALTTLDAENKELQRELERMKQQLADNLAREPILQEQIQSLEWQLSQKCRELEAVQEQMRLVEQRQNVEMEDLRKTIQDNQEELENLRLELSALRQEKMAQQAQASELRTTLKASIQHHKLTERINKKSSPEVSGSTRDMATQVEVKDIIIPPLPFDLEAVEKMIQSSSVRALESKPLDNLQSCLSSLRSEITGLQKQMENHTTTVQSTTQSWSAVEMSVNKLKDAIKNGGASSHETMATISIAAAGVDSHSNTADSSIIDI